MLAFMACSGRHQNKNSDDSSLFSEDMNEDVNRQIHVVNLNKSPGDIFKMLVKGQKRFEDVSHCTLNEQDLQASQFLDQSVKLNFKFVEKLRFEKNNNYLVGFGKKSLQFFVLDTRANSKFKGQAIVFRIDEMMYS